MIALERAEAIADQVESQGLDEATLQGLRSGFPEIHFTYCMEDDITSGKPVIEREAFHVFLVDGREHCLCLTNDFDVATGLVLAELAEDDG